MTPTATCFEGHDDDIADRLDATIAGAGVDQAWTKTETGQVIGCPT